MSTSAAANENATRERSPAPSTTQNRSQDASPSWKQAIPYIPYICIAIAIVVAAYLGAGWPALEFKTFNGGEIISKLGTLLMFALLIERTVEVFLTIWRAEEAYKREADVRRLINAGNTDGALKKAQEDLIEFKTATQRWALPASFIIGLILASFGVRVIDQFVVAPAADPSNVQLTRQLWCFHISDIVLTAALLAGGADPIHKFMDAIRKFMEATSAKASGTVKQ